MDLLLGKRIIASSWKELIKETDVRRAHYPWGHWSVTPAVHWSVCSEDVLNQSSPPTKLVLCNWRRFSYPKLTEMSVVSLTRDRNKTSCLVCATSHLSSLTTSAGDKQETQLMLTNLRDAFIGQSRSPSIVPFHMLDIVFPIVQM